MKIQLEAEKIGKYYKVGQYTLIHEKYCTVLQDNTEKEEPKNEYAIQLKLLSELKNTISPLAEAINNLKALPKEIPALEPRLCDKKEPLIGAKEYINSIPEPEIKPFRHHLEPVTEPVSVEQKEESEFVQKPPLGLMPEWRHKELRIQSILDVIKRYCDSQIVFPEEWAIELIELLVSDNFVIEVKRPIK